MAKNEPKFMVGDSPRSLMKIGGHRVPGGTWLSSGDVGVPVSVLKKSYPMLKWSDDKKAKKEKVEKLSKDEFYDLIRKDQEALLSKLNVKVSSKDKEADLWKKYHKA